MKKTHTQKRRSLVTLLVFLTFLTMIVTSVLMFTQPHHSATALTHTVIGFGLIMVAVLHMKNNFTALLNYFKAKTARLFFSSSIRFNGALFIAVGITATLILMSWYKVPPMQQLYVWGNTMRAQNEAMAAPTLDYSLVDKTTIAQSGDKLTIDLRQGTHFNWPQYAIWVEDMDGNFIQPIYVTSKLATNNFINKVTKIDKALVIDSHVVSSGKVNWRTTFKGSVEPESRQQRARPESLPVFLHKFAAFRNTETLIPDGESAVPDAYSGATILQSFLLTSALEQAVDGPFKVRLEINNSFDFNQYYSSDRFSEDPVYSGDGYSAQPSLVYEAVLDHNSDTLLFPMKLIGRGHHSGQTGDIYTDLDNMTTALEIVDRVIVELGQPVTALTQTN